MGQRMRILLAGCLVSLAGVGGALALASDESQPSVPSTGPFTQTTDPSREDYYDQITHEVPINRISEASKAAFGSRYADMAIVRASEPDVLRIYVVDATDEDEAELERIAAGHPQVALESADYTWSQILAAKEAVADLLARSEASWSFVEPDFSAQAVKVGGETEIEASVKERIRAVAMPVPAVFRSGPEYQAVPLGE